MQKQTNAKLYSDIHEAISNSRLEKVTTKRPQKKKYKKTKNNQTNAKRI